MNDADFIEVWRGIDAYVSKRDFSGLFAWCLYSFLKNPEVGKFKDPPESAIHY